MTTPDSRMLPPCPPRPAPADGEISDAGMPAAGKVSPAAPTPGQQYARRDVEALGVHYYRHLSAMTWEGLHGKNDIAAELAYRDSLIDDLAAACRAVVAAADLSQATFGRDVPIPADKATRALNAEIEATDKCRAALAKVGVSAAPHAHDPPAGIDLAALADTLEAAVAYLVDTDRYHTNEPIEGVALACEGFAKAARAALARRGKADPAASQWVRVSDRKPLAGEYVLVGDFTGESIWRATATHKGLGDFIDVEGERLHPSHWMPLPDPPPAERD